MKTNGQFYLIKTEKKNRNEILCIFCIIFMITDLLQISKYYLFIQVNKI